MRFGKRRDKQAPEGDGVVEAPPAPDSVTQDWTALGHDPGQPAEDSMPPPEQAAARQPEPVTGPEPVVAEAEAFVEGEAVELPYEAPVVEESPEPEPDPAAPMYEAPIYPHPIDPEPVVSVAASTPHHEPGLIPGVTEIRPASGGAWPEPAFDLAERPEILVGAAFGGGILLALILRRLGN